VLIGGIVVLGRLENPSVLDSVILVVAIVFGTINVVGGFLVTDRMLAMFKPKKAPEVEGAGVSRRGEREQTVPGGRPFGTEREGERR